MVAENCVFGDQPGSAFDGKDCKTFVDNFPGYCYQDVVRVRCCSSCAEHYRLLKGEQFGVCASERERERECACVVVRACVRA